jgi:hypothetical protein
MINLPITAAGNGGRFVCGAALREQESRRDESRGGFFDL